MIPVEEVNAVRKFQIKTNKLGQRQLTFVTVELKEQ